MNSTANPAILQAYKMLRNPRVYTNDDTPYIRVRPVPVANDNTPATQSVGDTESYSSRLPRGDKVLKRGRNNI